MKPNHLPAFKAYDIRGKWGEELDAELVYRIGYFLPAILRTKRMLIGMDCRHSSPEIFHALSEGMTDAGCDVLDMGYTTTPMVYWATGKLGTGGSVMITASHNPGSHNGLKVSAKNVVPVGYDNGLDKVEAAITGGKEIKATQSGQLEKVDMTKEYLAFLKNYTVDTGDLNISVDLSNGMAGLFARQLFGDQAFYLNAEPDGSFPAHAPNPLEPDNQEQIKRAVLENRSDIGLIFDGDADRVMFIDEKGSFISPDLIIALLGHYFFGERHEQGPVVQDIRTSRSVAAYLKRFGARMVTWKVGRAYGASKLQEVDGIYGGELAGHYYFRDFYYSDSGLLAAILVLRIVNNFHRKGMTFSQLMDTISTYVSTGEVNFRIENKKEAMEAVRNHFMKTESPERFLDFDGYRFDFRNWWFNIRPSNTEPYLRFIAEATDKPLLDEKTKIIFDLISKFS
jgi:phosphomannomutase